MLKRKIKYLHEKTALTWLTFKNLINYKQKLKSVSTYFKLSSKLLHKKDELIISNLPSLKNKTLLFISFTYKRK